MDAYFHYFTPTFLHLRMVRRIRYFQELGSADCMLS